MDLYTHPLIFRLIKVIQLLLALACLVLEIIQLVASSKYAPKLFRYFGERNIIGMKIFFYIVIPVTIVTIGWYLINFHNNWRSPSIYRDIGVESFLAILWVVSGLTNISPVYYNYLSLCPIIMDSPEHIHERRLVCHAYITSMSLGWVNAALFIISALLSWRLSKELEWRGTNNRLSTLSQIGRRNSIRTATIRRYS